MEIQDLKRVFEVLSLSGTTFDQAFAQFLKHYEGDPFKVTLCIYRLLQNKVHLHIIDFSWHTKVNRNIYSTSELSK